ncbi:MAG: hypothetical protein J7474_09130 [Arthrobacter sp.]|uniref:hypothetical protein n=1 Tax=Arthrobacter woluwensis TaxID=156980 RepID=UPI001B2CB018|nr:hypothetical protein [Arthrobacter woluwensis]MBO9705658.1 hypothetical protein [Arthrobacter sp.]MDQ0707479.1 putative cupredoxin-like copper-binding protein [Arthrobacter woluwensis]
MTGHAHKKRSGVEAVCSHLFAAATVLFLLGGAVIVFGQSVLVALGQGMAAMDLAETIGPYAFGLSSAAGLLAFVLTYFHDGEPSDGH